MKDRIQSAFAEIHADEALINRTAAYLRTEQLRQRRKPIRFSLPARVRAAAVTAVLLLVTGVFSYRLYFTCAAHISIDVNPSIELTLNRFDRVIDTYAFNSDGEKVLKKLDLRGKAYDEAAKLLLSAIKADGYIIDDALISVTVQSASVEKEQMLCGSLLAFVNESVVAATAEVEVYPVSAEVWNDAHGCHMSPARYLAVQELMEVDETAVIDDYTDTPIRQIRQRTQECGHANTSGSSADSSSESSSYTQNSQVHGEQKGHGHRGGH